MTPSESAKVRVIGLREPSQRKQGPAHTKEREHRSTLAGEVRRLVVDGLGSLGGRTEVPVVDLRRNALAGEPRGRTWDETHAGDPGHASTEHLNLERVLRAELGELLGKVGLDERVDIVRGEVGNEADGKLACSKRSLVREASRGRVEQGSVPCTAAGMTVLAPPPENAPSIPWIERLVGTSQVRTRSQSALNDHSSPGVAHAAHEHLGLVLAEGDLGSDGGLEVGDGDVDDIVAGLLLLGKRGDLVGDSGDEDLALRGDELGEHGEEVRHGLCDRPKVSECARYHLGSSGD